MTHPQIDIVHAREEYETLLKCADLKQRRIDATLAEHGDGLRRSWVSAEIGRDKLDRDSYLAEAETLRATIKTLETQLTEGDA